MAQGYEVEPAALELASQVFDVQGKQAEIHAGVFLGLAALPDSAFGNLPESYKLANQFQAFFQQVQTDLKALQDSLNGCSKRLTQTAKNYRVAEGDNTLPGQR